MKKLLLMVALAFTTLNMNAQDESKITVKAGVGISSVVGSDADTKNSLSYKVGVSYDWGVAENFSIIPGVEFAVKGHKVDGIDGSINKGYLQIPIFAAYKFRLSDSMKLALKVGPYFGFGVVGSDIEFAGGGKVNIFDKDDGFDRFDAGIIAGVSLDIDKFVVGVEYSRGFKKLVSDMSAFNQGVGVVVGYKF